MKLLQNDFQEHDGEPTESSSNSAEQRALHCRRAHSLLSGQLHLKTQLFSRFLKKKKEKRSLFKFETGQAVQKRPQNMASVTIKERLQGCPLLDQEVCQRSAASKSRGTTEQSPGGLDSEPTGITSKGISIILELQNCFYWRDIQIFLFSWRPCDTRVYGGSLWNMAAVYQHFRILSRTF